MTGVILLLCSVPTNADQSPSRQKVSEQIQNLIEEANRLRLQGKLVEAVAEGKKAVALVRLTFGDNAGEVPPQKAGSFV